MNKLRPKERRKEQEGKAEKTFADHLGATFVRQKSSLEDCVGSQRETITL